MDDTDHDDLYSGLEEEVLSDDDDGHFSVRSFSEILDLNDGSSQEMGNAALGPVEELLALPTLSSSESELNESQEGEHAESFNLDLPPEHTYLGNNMEIVSGRIIWTEGSCVTLPVLPRAYGTLIPGQTFPLNVRDPPRTHLLRSCVEKDHTFGCIASRPSLLYNAKYNPSGKKEDIIGTTAEIFEFSDNVGTISIKAKARQRFRLLKSRKNEFNYHVAEVEILPEIILPDPFQEIRLEALNRFRTKQSKRCRMRDAHLTHWPSWVYDIYDPKKLVERVDKELCFLKQGIREIHAKVPKDPTDLSFWIATHLDTDERLFALRLNCPVQRLLWLLQLMKKSQYYSCQNCDRAVGEHSDVFAMSVEGAQSTYVNPHGYLHETITLREADNLTVISAPSTQFSWFPGYAWSIAVCDACHSHIGWQFKATNPKLVPATFWGLTRHALSTKIMFRPARTEEGIINQ